MEAYRGGDLSEPRGDLQKASKLAPDVPYYYFYQSRVYAALLENRVFRYRECSLGVGGATYDACLLRKDYMVNRVGMDQRSSYWPSRMPLANSALTLGWNGH